MLHCSPMETTTLLLDTLNDAQRQAVTAPLGPIVVLAGAGSGKTRVLVQRIAWLIGEKAMRAHSVLAVTFTNKAAGEMKHRLSDFLGQEAQGMWVGTFHGLAHKMLRLHWQEAGLLQQFQVMDGDDQLQMIRRIFKQLSVNEDRFDPRKVQGFISRKKDEGIRINTLPPIQNPYDQVVQEVYRQYEKICEASGLVDFSELLLRSYELLKNNAELRTHYQARFSHILVDEFQDTNTIQYQWLSLLAEQAQSMMVVGDDDQSIYGWRGAKIENLHRFQRDFKDVQMIRLEQNYRSTGTILAAANALITHNDSRLGKTLWTEGETGEAIGLYAGFNEEDEALYVVRGIREWMQKGGLPQAIGLLYRSNAQSRILEESLMRAGIPYSIYGGLRFFERAEIKDALAYLKLALNVKDNTAFQRIINVPPRGIGEKSLEKIQIIAQTQSCSYWEAAHQSLGQGLLGPKIESALRGFLQLVEALRMDTQGGTPLMALMEQVVQQSGILRFFKEQKDEKSQNRAENLEELINASNDFELAQDTTTQSSLVDFLAYTALESAEKPGRSLEAAVQLMTIHAAKGLEFPVVFVCGLEDGLFPHHFSRDNPASLEEERRLCYVAITRAKEKLFLSYALKRRVFGRDEDRFPSRFISEIPRHLLAEQPKKVSVQRPLSLMRSFSASAPSNPIKSSIASSAVSESGIALGQWVRHPKFGTGIVVDQEGSGERARVHVKFDIYGNKWLALAYAKLEPV
jgi:DNA helicase II / ATP-dependent DNA helicase PcrA